MREVIGMASRETIRAIQYPVCVCVCVCVCAWGAWDARADIIEEESQSWTGNV